MVFETRLRARTTGRGAAPAGGKQGRQRIRKVISMTWLGGFIIGVGVLLVSVLGGYAIVRAVRRRAGSRADRGAYAGRLDPELGTVDREEIHLTAESLIGEHGADAVIEAARRALATLDEGDVQARAVWRRVLESAEDSRARDGDQDEAAA